MFKMLKLLIGGKKGLIKSMDEIEPAFAEIIKKAQKTAGDIPADQFAKEVVDQAQLKLCQWLDVDPKEVGL